VSHNKWIISFVDLSLASALSCSTIFIITVCIGLISNAFFGYIYADIDVSIKACAFISCRKFAINLYSSVTIMHGAITSLLKTVTFSQSSQKAPLMFHSIFSNLT
jgi:hypothetical protein